METLMTRAQTRHVTTSAWILLSARLCAGLLAGLYFAFAVAVMPALRGTDDGAFVDMMKRINVSIVNPVFLLVFFAAPALAVLAAALVRSPVAYAAAALAVLTLLVTVVFNVPLNDRLADGAARADFETAWVRFNGLRTVTGIGSLVCLLISRSAIQ